MSHSLQQIQEKTDFLNTMSTQIGLNINRSKKRIMKANTKNKNPVIVGGEPLEETDSFKYLGIINKSGGTEEDVKAPIPKARVTFLKLRIWKAKQIKLNSKLRIFNSNVKSVLFYGSVNYTRKTKKNTDLHQQMPAQNLTHKMVRQGIQLYATGKDQTTVSRKRNKEEKMEVDITHTEETSNKHHTIITYMELPREEKKRKAKKHLAERQRK